MKSFKSVLAGGGVCLAAVFLTIPFILLSQPTSQEFWIVEAMREMRQHFQLVPRLNGMELPGQNPIQIMLLSCLPASIALGRLVMIVLGLILAASLYLYSHLLWGWRAGVCAVLFTVSSIGFLQGFSLLNTAALPCAFFIWGYLIFSLAYLKGWSRNWYLLAYVCVLAAMLLGGLELVVLFVGAVILLILFDLSPQRFSRIRPVIGLGALIGTAFIFYVTYRISGGSSYVGGILWPGGHLGLFKALAFVFHATLPWLPLLVPAWIFTARPEEWEDWRTLLPAKIALILVVVLLWFSGQGIGGYAFLAAPPAGLLIGYWAGGGLRVATRLKIVRRIAFLCTALILLVLPIVDLGLNPRTVLDLSMVQIILLIATFATVAAMLFMVRGRRHGAAIIAGLLAVCVLAWQAPLSERNEGPSADYLESIARYQPLLVLEDDLVMRGALGFSGVQPLVVSGAFVPVGGEAYLAVATGKLKRLLKNLQGRMQASAVIKTLRGTTYALIRVAPQAPQESPPESPAPDPVPRDAEGI